MDARFSFFCVSFRIQSKAHLCFVTTTTQSLPLSLSLSPSPPRSQMSAAGASNQQQAVTLLDCFFATMEAKAAMTITGENVRALTEIHKTNILIIQRLSEEYVRFDKEITSLKKEVAELKAAAAATAAAAAKPPAHKLIRRERSRSPR